MKRIFKENKFLRLFLILLFFIVPSIFVISCNEGALSDPVIHYFSADPPMITEGESSNLSWSVEEADIVSINHGVGVVTLTGTMAVNPTENTTYILTATNSTSTVTAMTTVEVNPLPALIISQTDGEVAAALGHVPIYTNVGQGQSFLVTESGYFDQFHIYLSSYQSESFCTPTSSADTIICDLRDANGNILQSVSIPGFNCGNEGWQIFDFNMGTYLTPGIYYCTCYVKNPLKDHVYNCHANADDNSYLSGSRYDSRGGNPGDWNTWTPYPWDLMFKVMINIFP